MPVHYLRDQWLYDKDAYLYERGVKIVRIVSFVPFKVFLVVGYFMSNNCSIKSWKVKTHTLIQNKLYRERDSRLTCYIVILNCLE